jgi:hypothetical protein
MFAAADAVRTIDPVAYAVVELVERTNPRAMYMCVGLDLRESRILIAFREPEAEFKVEQTGLQTLELAQTA